MLDSIFWKNNYGSDPVPYKKVRNSNIELYRIIVMFFIVSHHYLVHSGLLNIIENDSLSIKTAFFYIFGMWGKTGINCFVLITGYFMCKNNISVNKFLKLLFQVEFYNILLNSIFIILGYENFTKKNIYRMLWPIIDVSDMFTPCFLLFYMCIPFLNILIHNMNKKQHQFLLALSLFIYTILGTTTIVKVSMNYVTWFCVLYFISSYIRIYGINYKDVKIKWGWLSFISIIISAMSVLFFSTIVNIPGREFILVSDSNHIMAVITSVCLFMYFKDLPIKYNRYINHIGMCTFGIFLLHDNSPVMRHFLWHDLFKNVIHYYDDFYFIYAIITVSFIFILCVCIETVRNKFIEKPFLKYISRYL